MKEKIYILAAIESIINKNTATDLDSYRLEYFLDLGNYTTSFYESLDVALIIGVKIRNKETNEIEWANIYYKVFAKNVSINDIDKKNALKEILLSSKENQLNFILKQETSILKRTYVTSDFAEPNEFVQELKLSTSDNYPVIKLGGVISKQVKQMINQKIKEVVAEFKSELDVIKKFK